MTIEFTVENVKAKMQTALDEYTGETNASARSNMPYGLFSWARHRSSGKALANQFMKDIENAQDVKEASRIIDTFLTNLTSYKHLKDLHRHSFASYVLDELSNFKYLDYISLYKIADINDIRYTPMAIVAFKVFNLEIQNSVIPGVPVSFGQQWKEKAERQQNLETLAADDFSDSDSESNDSDSPRPSVTR